MRPGAQKLLEIVADIVFYEAHHAHDGELLSEFFDRIIERNPIAARIGVICFFSLLTAHLANLYPDSRYDIFSTHFWKRH